MLLLLLAAVAVYFVVVGLQCYKQRGTNTGVSSIRGAKVDTATVSIETVHMRFFLGVTLRTKWLRTLCSMKNAAWMSSIFVRSTSTSQWSMSQSLLMVLLRHYQSLSMDHHLQNLIMVLLLHLNLIMVLLLHQNLIMVFLRHLNNFMALLIHMDHLRTNPTRIPCIYLPKFRSQYSLFLSQFITTHIFWTNLKQSPCMTSPLSTRQVSLNTSGEFEDKLQARRSP